MPYLYIPFREISLIKREDELWSLGFDKIEFKELENGEVCFIKDYEDVEGRVKRKKRDVIRVIVSEKSGVIIKGQGARFAKEWILGIWEWYKIAKGIKIYSNISFAERLVFDPLEEFESFLDSE